MEIYLPSQDDRLRLRPKANSLKVSGDGAFATLQGEGVTAGLPAVFLRLHYCNLACGVNDGWKCDTDYTWDRKIQAYWKEPTDWTYEQTAEIVANEWKRKFSPIESPRLVITGGEPLLQQRKIIELLTLLKDWNIEIETNGTISPDAALEPVQINASPKLSNSGNSKVKRYKPDVLRRINGMNNSWFKFVVMDRTDLPEINQIITECELDPNKILIMPEGQTREVTESHLAEITDEVESRGWTLTNRNQLIWFGPKRRT